MGRRFNTIVRVLAAFVVVGALAVAVLPAVAGESPRATKTPPPAVAADSPRTPVPKPPKAAKGTECVEPVADMRRNHMIYLEHERDETVHKGIRARKHSLKGCVECHAVPDPAVAGESPRSLDMPPSRAAGESPRSSGTPPLAAGGARTAQPFCTDCHRYVAVKIDCFGCHAATPETRAAGSESSRRLFNGGGDSPAAAPAGKSP